MQVNSNMSIGSVIDAISSVEKTDKKSTENFSDILSDTLRNVAETESESDQGTINLLSGEDASIHETVIQTEKAELALELALQVRNKVIDAYKEIMQMQL